MPNPRLNPTMTALITALLAAALIVIAPAGPAGAQQLLAQSEGQFVEEVNIERAAVGADPLIVDVNMTAAARAWTLDMATREVLEHASVITDGVPDGWVSAGENVGRGGTISGLMNAFMKSTGHRENLLNPAYTHIGVGVYLTETNVLYTTHRFAAVPGATVQPTSPPTPVPATPIPPTPVPPTPVPPTPVPPTPVPVPTATPVSPTPVPPTPVPPTPTPIPPTPIPPTPTPDPGLGAAPDTLAFAEPGDLSSAGSPVLSAPPATFNAATDQVVKRFSWLIELLIRLFG